MQQMGLENDQDMLKFIQSRTGAEAGVNRQRGLAFGRDARYQHFCKALDERLRQLMADNPNQESFPAVDLAAGAAVYTVQYALRYRPPFLRASLEWYPTDWEGKEDAAGCGPLSKETRPAIEFMAKEAQADYPLFQDAKGGPVYPNDKVVLDGLSRAEFNGLRGKIIGKDEKKQGRFAVQIDKQNNSLSFQSSNISKIDCPENECRDVERSSLRALSSTENNEDQDFYRGLLERSCRVDILNHKTWQNLAAVYGKCALTICTSFLSCMGYRDPDAWQGVLELASKLLITGGYLLTYDTDKWGGYSNVPVMEEYVSSKNLGLILDERSEPIAYDDSEGRMFLLVWKKVDTDGSDSSA